MTDAELATDLVDALFPLVRRLHAERTLSPGKIGVLRHLREHGRATTSELAAVVRVSPQGISLAVRELEALDLISRTPDHEDRRRTWIEMTERGRETLVAESAAGAGWLVRAIADDLDDRERRALAAALPVLHRLAQELPRG